MELLLELKIRLHMRSLVYCVGSKRLLRAVVNHPVINNVGYGARTQQRTLFEGNSARRGGCSSSSDFCWGV